jgi:hypothetical protein
MDLTFDPRYLPATSVPGGVDAERLTRRQRDGGDCVHCGVTLGPETAVGLGTHVYKVVGVGGLTEWWPRSCRTCHTRRAGT